MKYCLADTLLEAFCDLPYIPLFAFGLIAAPWRILPYIIRALDSPPNIKYEDYVKLQVKKRQELYDSFCLGILDTVTIIWLLLSVCYLWRFPKFIQMIREPYKDSLYTDEKLYVYRNYLGAKFIPALSCGLHLFIHDIPFLPFFFIALLTPWRFYFWIEFLYENIEVSSFID